MRSLVICILVVLILQLSVVGGASAASLPPPFDTEPFHTDGTGNGARNQSGSFRDNGGPEQYRYFIGTNVTPGSLIMDWAVPFTDGPGNDFAILTNSQAWGPLADEALFEFFLGGNLQASFIASLAPDQLFQFDLPGSGLVADRVVVTNITPDPLPINEDLATMTFDDAGVAYVVSTIEIDIKPGNDTNRINLKSKGMVQVAVLTTDSFNAETVDPATVEFADAPPVSWKMKDVDGDGDIDLLFKFKTQELSLDKNSTEATLTGATFGGTLVQGTDSVNIVPKGK